MTMPREKIAGRIYDFDRYKKACYTTNKSYENEILMDWTEFGIGQKMESCIK